jgi:hypothetical protein
MRYLILSYLSNSFHGTHCVFFVQTIMHLCKLHPHPSTPSITTHPVDTGNMARVLAKCSAPYIPKCIETLLLLSPPSLIPDAQLSKIGSEHLLKVSYQQL